MAGVSLAWTPELQPREGAPHYCCRRDRSSEQLWRVAGEAGPLTENVGPMVTPVGMGTTATNSPPFSHRKFKMILFLEELLSSPTHYLWFGSPGKEVFLSIGDETRE